MTTGDLLLADVANAFKEKNIVLIPCLYILLWFLSRTPVIKKKSWLLHDLVLVGGAVFSVLLNGFNIYSVMLGITAGGIAVLLYRRREDKCPCKCVETKKKKPKKNE